MSREYALVLPGTVRSKKNSREVRNGKSGSRFMGASESYRKWEQVAQLAARQQLRAWRIFKPFTGRIRLTVRAYYKGPRPDFDAPHTAVMDALQGIAWMDDNQIDSWGADCALIHDKKNPRTEVIFELLDQ